MKRITLLLSLLCVGFVASAQETHRYAQKDTSALYLDIHRPAADAQTMVKDSPKPTILYVFGGGFFTGARNEEYVLKWFRMLNDDGYTVVSIDYRLGMKNYRMGKGLIGAAKASKQLLRSQQMGVEDVFSAIRFLSEHPELGIDVKNLVLSGSSAGAIISLACAKALADGSAEVLPDGFRFKGVMAFSGGIISRTGAPKFISEPCPMLLFHGMDDKAVAYEHYGAFGIGIWGSSYIASQLQKKGWNCSIWRFRNRAHDVAAYMKLLWPMEKEFLEKTITLGVPCAIDATVDDPSLPVWSSWGSLSVEDMYNGPSLSGDSE